MPTIPFEQLPANARLWVFAADAPVTGEHAERLLGAVDDFLDRWQAHGEPLRCARDWRDDRFLAIGVDQNDAHASGCSIDGLFRSLQTVQREIGTRLLGAERVFYRDATNNVRVTDREQFSALASRGEISDATRVFDTTVQSREAWDQRFEMPAKSSWHHALISRAR